MRAGRGLVIGLTGGVASGKSTVARYLAGRGAVVIDADRIGHEVISKGRPAWRELRREFGEGILVTEGGKEGEIDRRKLGRIVFADRRARKRLNAIVHPRLRRELARRVKELRAEGHLVVVDAALLIEAGWDRQVDCVVVVDTPRRLQLQRLLKAGFSRREALGRMNAQATRREKRKAADIIIRNDGTLRDLRKRSQALYAEITGRTWEG